MICAMAHAILTTRPEPASRATAALRDAHRRQRELVRASLMCRPAVGRPTHRRWA
jgi:hypothetical protein